MSERRSDGGHRIVALPVGGAHALDSSVLQTAFADAYEKLVNLQPVRCVKTEAEITTVRSPDVVLVDVSLAADHSFASLTALQRSLAALPLTPCVGSVGNKSRFCSGGRVHRRRSFVSGALRAGVEGAMSVPGAKWSPNGPVSALRKRQHR